VNVEASNFFTQVDRS